MDKPDGGVTAVTIPSESPPESGSFDAGEQLSATWSPSNRCDGRYVSWDVAGQHCWLYESPAKDRNRPYWFISGDRWIQMDVTLISMMLALRVIMSGSSP